MNWKELSTLGQLDRIDELSAVKPVLIFKHSTRCNISNIALHRLERRWTHADATAHPAYLLDLLAHRDISDAVSTRYQVRHESPQVLVIGHGRSMYNAAHMGITYEDALAALARGNGR